MDDQTHATWEKYERATLLTGAKSKATGMCKCCKEVKVVITSTMPKPGIFDILTPSPADDKTYTKKCPEGEWTSTKADGDFSNLYPD
jgi:hypothetical protein